MPRYGLETDTTRDLLADHKEILMASKISLGIAALVFAAGSAGAKQPSNVSAWFDPATGTGFISAGAILGGWSGAPVPPAPTDYANIKSFVENGGFSMIVRHFYTGVCRWTGQDGITVAESSTVERRDDTDLLAAVTRSHSPIKMGVLLQGFSSASREDTRPAPINGGPCFGETGVTGSWTYVAQSRLETQVEELVRGAAAGLKVWPLPTEFIH
jgi:hypothetical protein